jgi:uncharacterized protein with HEPN domain
LPFRDNQTHLHDILEGIDHIESFVGDITFDAYRSDLKTKSAVERQLQVITEAAKRLGDAAEELCHGPDWKGFCRMGDILRHGYHKVDDEIVWNCQGRASADAGCDHEAAWQRRLNSE